LKKKVKCNVCGTRFFPNIYMAKGSCGVTTALTTGQIKYDVCDCPECGRQIVLGERYERCEADE